jgi:hypothetical protein
LVDVILDVTIPRQTVARKRDLAGTRHVREIPSLIDDRIGDSALANNQLA